MCLVIGTEDLFQFHFTQLNTNTTRKDEPDSVISIIAIVFF